MFRKRAANLLLRVLFVYLKGSYTATITYNSVCKKYTFYLDEDIIFVNEDEFM